MSLPSLDDLLGPSPHPDSEEEPPQPKRVRRHCAGDYTAHVYAPLTFARSSRELRGLIKVVTKKLEDASGVRAHPVLATNSTGEKEDEGRVVLDSWHVSLSRVATLRPSQLDTFSHELKRQFQSQFEPFSVLFEDLLVLANEDDSTCFVCIGVRDKPSGHLDHLVDRADRVYKRHGLREYFAEKERRHHLSLAWAPGEGKEALRGAVSRLGEDGEVSRAMRVLREAGAAKVEGVRWKIGQRVTSFP